MSKKRKKKLPIRNMYRHVNYRLSYQILQVLKRTFTRSDTVQEIYEERKIKKPVYNKDGRRSKRDAVWYKCEICEKEFKQKEMNCDHIEPVIPLNIPTEHMSWDILITERLFVDKDNLQLVCKGCHKEKTKEENRIRKEWREKEKYIIYKTVNRINHKYYIGIHKCKDLNDGYIGSGTLLTAAVKKYGRDNFNRYVLYVYDNEKDALDKEKELVTMETVRDKLSYNIAPGGQYFNKNQHNNLTKITAINKETGKRIEFDSIADCCRELDLTPSTVYAMCKGNIHTTYHRGWTFETEKYGKVKPRKKDMIPEFSIKEDKKRGFVVNSKGKYITSRQTKEEAEQVLEYLNNGGEVSEVKRFKRRPNGSVEKKPPKEIVPVKCHQNGKVYRTQAEACEELGLHSGSLNEVLKGKRKTTGGYTFEYYHKDKK